MMKVFLLRFLLLFFWCFQLAYAADAPEKAEEYFVHRDQFLLNDNENQQKKSFYQELQCLNAEKSQKIRLYTSDPKNDIGNILLVSLHVFYDDQYADYETKERPKIFLSGWLPTEAEAAQEFFEKELFCLGSAYAGYYYFDNATKILNIKRKSGYPSLSESIRESSDFHLYKDPKKSPRDRGSINFEDTFIYKLINDFGTRDINFELPGGMFITTKTMHILNKLFFRVFRIH